MPLDQQNNRLAVLFDLDGTLVDPAGGITQGIAYALQSMALPVPEQDILNAMVGPKLSEGLLALPNFPADKLSAVVAAYREWYSARGIAMGRPYPGMVELLETLRRRGFLIGLATQKPLSLARVLLDTHGLSGFFQAVSGAAENEALNTADSLPPKQRIIETALEELSSPPRAIMVGDRAHDVLGARANGLDCLGVNWGFSATGELEKAGAIHTVDSAEELLARISEYFALEVANGSL
ncbi:haloacid dehalogenase [Psychromicrobium lacuslunae]|uniref:Haloacid dehalogenase n=1 Tax=Psychromicrobium lacuslunae TaxID=1618207 RepID=A0A0D4C2M6_9MICC|nr:haloacid dehalogenase [Psychromicrobium lacuslunae]